MFAPGRNKIYLSGIELTNGTIKLQKYKNQKGLNINFLIDYFSSGSKDTSKKAVFDFNPGEINLNNIQFVYKDNRYSDKANGIDFEDIRVYNLDATVNDVTFDADTMYATIENLGFLEKSGFQLEYLEANVKVTAQGMEYQNLLLKTDETNIQGSIAFNYDDIVDFDEFIDKVKINSSFEKAHFPRMTWCFSPVNWKV
ncbi:MAG: hypothetical protein IPP71_14190 [Bacteroidetes bacterium]|nr:hypothetical protein [Bacteroidota bacterium]